MKKFLFLLLLFSTNFNFAQTSQQRLLKILDDDNTNFTNVGNIGLTITNFGTYGHGFSLWPQQPSCEYPIGSGFEHLFLYPKIETKFYHKKNDFIKIDLILNN